MTTTITGLDLYDAVLAHIAAHPEQWDQRVWLQTTECGTVGCFAGWTVVLGGGDREDVRESARALLELDARQASSVFSGQQTFEGLSAWRAILAPGRTDLSGLALSGAVLRSVDLHGADLRGADLRESYLRWADLREVDLRLADLCEADLRRADLRWAVLAMADLSAVDLSGADLRGADLSGATLSAVDLSGADLRGTDLSGAVLAMADLRWATYDDATVWPEGYDAEDGVNRSLAGISGASPDRRRRTDESAGS